MCAAAPVTGRPRWTSCRAPLAERSRRSAPRVVRGSLPSLARRPRLPWASSVGALPMVATRALLAGTWPCARLAGGASRSRTRWPGCWPTRWPWRWLTLRAWGRLARRRRAASPWRRPVRGSASAWRTCRACMPSFPSAAVRPRLPDASLASSRSWTLEVRLGMATLMFLMPLADPSLGMRSWRRGKPWASMPSRHSVVPASGSRLLHRLAALRRRRFGRDPRFCLYRRAPAMVLVDALRR